MHEARIRARARALPPAFLRELARPNLPLSETHGAIAGLVVLRVVDRWVAGGCRPSAVPAGARWAVGDLEPGNPARGILGAVLDAMEATEDGAITSAVRHFLAYGRHLEFEAKWEMALCVYGAVTDYAGVAASAQAVCDAWLRRAYCLRTLARLDEAVAAYHRAHDAAHRAHDPDAALRSEIGRAVVEITRGRLEEADRALCGIAARAEAGNLPAVLATALHHRAIVAGLQGAPARAAVELAFRALQLTPHASERDRVLFDIGESLRMSGMRDAARDAFLILSCTSQERHIRWHAVIMLMRIAGDDGQRKMFEHYRTLLDPAAFPPRLALEFHIQCGYGFRSMGDDARSEAEFRRARREARAWGHTTEMRHAERALAGHSDAVDRPSPETLEGLGEVIDSLRAMRESAVAG